MKFVVALLLQTHRLTDFSFYLCSYDNPDQGSDHGSDLQALFNAASTVSGDDSTLFTAMQQFWTSFVTSAAPKSEAAATNWTVSLLPSRSSESYLVYY